MAPLSGKARRTKGHDWEREFARMARLARIPAIRHPQYRGESDGHDVELFPGTSLAVNVECKNRQNFPSAAVVRIVKEGQTACIKVTGVGTFIGLSIEDYFDLLKSKANQ